MLMKGLILVIAWTAVVGATPICVQYWTCLTKDTVMAYGFSFGCANKQVCNTDVTLSCAPCVDVLATTTSTTTTTTTTTTTKATPSTSTPSTSTPSTSTPSKSSSSSTTPSSATASTPLPSTTTPSTPTSSTTTTSTTTPSTTTPSTITPSTTTTSTTTTTTTTPTPPLNLPDCNDANGTTLPCRKGPLVPNFYYKCKRVWYWNEYDIIPCSQLANDAVCAKTAVCTV